MIVALAVVAGLGAMLVFLLATASADTTFLAEHTVLLIVTNAVAAFVLLGMVVVQLRKLWREYRRGKFGAKLKARLLAMLVFMAVVPGVLVYAVSMQFAVKSIDSWFDVRVEAALDGGLDLGRGVFDAMQDDLLTKARVMAYDLSNVTTPGPVLLNRLREQAGVRSASLLTAGGKFIANSSGDLQGLLPQLPETSLLRKARLGTGVARIEGDATAGFIVRVLVPLSSYRMGGDPLVLLLEQPVPAALTKSADAVDAARREYQELQLSRTGLKRMYTLTLTFALLLALFAAIALAFFLAARIARPLLLLAEGTRAVAAGDFTPRKALETGDELGVLTRSFNAMTAQLNQARNDREAAHAFIEGVLANLSTGVLAFEGNFVLRTANRGACAILGEDLCASVGATLADWPDRSEFKMAVQDAFASRDEWQRQIEFDDAGGAKRILLLRGSTLPGDAGRVVVFDDISPVIAAQRSAAWGEVARRLAHEIKNPLTPIQLSAERLQMKLADKLDADSAAMLGRATRTIVGQVEAMKNMVNDFRDYARLPPPMPVPLDLNVLVGEVLDLYADGLQPVLVELDPTLPPVLADPDQIRQVLHNLVKNASEATTEKAGATSVAGITVKTDCAGRMARLSVADHGAGFRPEILARAFEPYVTTKPKGTGLGLAIVKKIADDHGGEIQLTNRSADEGGGAEVSLLLPLHQSVQQPDMSA